MSRGGLKAMAIAAQRWYENFRPSGVKVHTGATVIELGMVEQNFKEMTDAGAILLGDIPAEIAFCLPMAIPPASASWTLA